QVVEQPAEVSGVPAEPGQLHDDEGVAGTQVSEASVPLWSVRAALAGGGFGEDPLAPVVAEFVELSVEGLVGGADAGVADERHGGLPFMVVPVSGHGEVPQRLAYAGR